MHTINGENFLVSFGGYSGRYSNQVYALKASLKSSVLFQQINEAGTNGIAPISPISESANSSRKVIFEIEELHDKVADMKMKVEEGHVLLQKQKRDMC